MRKNEQNFIRKIKDQKEKIEKLFKKKFKKNLVLHLSWSHTNIRQRSTRNHNLITRQVIIPKLRQNLSSPTRIQSTQTSNQNSNPTIRMLKSPNHSLTSLKTLSTNLRITQQLSSNRIRTRTTNNNSIHILNISNLTSK